MQKAMKWLDAKKIDYHFHNYKESGIDTKGNTYRALTDMEKGSINNKTKAIALMMKNTSLIKRPVWDLGNGNFFLGWDEKELSTLV